MFGSQSTVPIELLLKAGADVNWKSQELNCLFFRIEGGVTVLDDMEWLDQKQYRYKVLKIISDAGFNFSANQGIVKKTLQMGITYQSASLDELVLLCTNSSYETLTSIQFLEPDDPDY